MPDGTPNINELFVRHPANYKLAKLTLYTKGKTLAEQLRAIGIDPTICSLSGNVITSHAAVVVGADLGHGGF